MTVQTLCFDMAGSGDVSQLEQWVGTLEHARIRRLVVMAKTEGHHAPNDFSRDLLKLRLDQVFERFSLSTQALSMLAIGSEGVGSPKGFAFVDIDDATPPTGATPAATEARLALGTACSAEVPTDDIGTLRLVDRVTQCARQAIADAGLLPNQVELLFIKSPTLPARHPAATPRNSLLHRGRAISALGGGVALGEVDRSRLTEDNITQDLSIYTRHVQGIAGAEIRRIEVVAMGNRPGAAGHLKIASTHIRDMLDQRSLRALIAAQGLQFDSLGELQDGERIEALIAKMMVSEDGLLRGSRTTVWTSGWAPESHIRAAASGVLGSLLGHLRFFVSADSVHQAPEGGGMAAIVVRC
jgi:cyanuric acid amidohydrolase